MRKMLKGFAAMDPGKLRQLGRNVGNLRKGHKWAADEAKTAGRKGGIASGKTRRMKKKIREAIDQQSETITTPITNKDLKAFLKGLR